jgi:hypothetical protein
LETWEAFLELVSHPPYSHWAFRGERDERWPLFSSLSRYLQNSGVAPGAWSEQEARILRIFKRKAHQFLDKPPDWEDDFQWLALMQHHGAPTRLIDFTWSPYVAAFFALERTLGDGVVWAMNPARVDSSRAPTPVRTDPRVKDNFQRFFLKGRRQFIWMGEPHTMNRRLIAQSGTFAVPSVLDVAIEDMLSDADQENILAKCVLTHVVREVGMRELYRMNITYATLFPDLDGLAKSMGYELEYHWAYNPRTMEKYHTSGGGGRRRKRTHRVSVLATSARRCWTACFQSSLSASAPRNSAARAKAPGRPVKRNSIRSAHFVTASPVTGKIHSSASSRACCLNVSAKPLGALMSVGTPRAIASRPIRPKPSFLDGIKTRDASRRSLRISVSSAE